MTYCQLPIVDTGGIIGFEMKVEEGPLVKSRVNKLSLLSPIWPLNKSAMFALSHVCLLPRERLIFSSERQGQAYRRPATRLNSLICGLSREGLCLWVPTWAKQPSSSASGQKLGAKYYYSTKYDCREDKRSEKSFKRPQNITNKHCRIQTPCTKKTVHSFCITKCMHLACLLFGESQSYIHVWFNSLSFLFF